VDVFSSVAGVPASEVVFDIKFFVFDKAAKPVALIVDNESSGKLPVLVRRLYLISSDMLH